MPRTHCAFLHWALSSTARSSQHFLSVEMLKLNVHLATLKPGGLIARAIVYFSVFTRVTISLSVMYYKYKSCYWILSLLHMEYAVIDLNIYIYFKLLSIYLQEKLRSCWTEDGFSLAGHEIICSPLIHLCWV